MSDRILLVRLFDSVLTHGTSHAAFLDMVNVALSRKDWEVAELLEFCTVEIDTPTGTFVKFQPQYMEPGKGIAGLI